MLACLCSARLPCTDAIAGSGGQRRISAGQVLADVFLSLFCRRFANAGLSGLGYLHLVCPLAGSFAVIFANVITLRCTKLEAPPMPPIDSHS